MSEVEYSVVDLGAVTAYAQAVENGYTGTLEQWAQLQINSANNYQELFNEIYSKDSSAALWEQGGLSASSGATSSGTTRIRTTDFLPDSVAKIVMNTGYYIMVYVYGNDGTFIGVLKNNYNLDGNERTAEVVKDVAYAATCITGSFDLRGLKNFEREANEELHSEYYPYKYKIVAAFGIQGTTAITPSGASNITFYENNVGHAVDNELIGIGENEPDSDRAVLWIDKDGATAVHVPEIDDDHVSDVDTWSSEKINSELGQLSEDLESVEQDIGIRHDVKFPVVSGKYIGNDNNEKTGQYFSHSEPIAVSAGDVIEFTATGYLTSIAMIALTDANATSYQMVARSIDSTERLYTYTCTADGYIVVSYANNQNHNLTIISADSIQKLYNADLLQLAIDSGITVIAENAQSALLESGKYIRNNGTVATAANFNIHGSINLPKGSRFIFNAIGYSTNLAILSKVNSDGTYTPLIISEDGDEHTFTYTALSDMSVVISTYKSITPVYSLYSSRIDENAAKINDIDADYVAFATMGVIGDSLASGASNYTNGAADRKDYAWGKFIEREHGINVSLFSSGGSTTRSWLAQSYGLAALQAADVLDCYIIGLGVNDAYSLGSNYLGTVSDVHVGSESQNADTYYGNYSKIIAAIKTKSPRAKIFCITNPRASSETDIAYNDAVEDIVALYTNTYLIDLVGDDFYTSTEFKSTWYSAHSTAVGYKLIAKNLYNHINTVIQENVTEFLDIQWIVENHE